MLNCLLLINLSAPVPFSLVWLFCFRRFITPGQHFSGSVPGCCLPWWKRCQCARQSLQLTALQGSWGTTGYQSTTDCWWATRTAPGDSSRLFTHIRGTRVVFLLLFSQFAFYLCCVWIPAQDPVVLPAAQEQLRISQAPGDGKNTPVHENSTLMY